MPEFRPDESWDKIAKDIYKEIKDFNSSSYRIKYPSSIPSSINKHFKLSKKYDDEIINLLQITRSNQREFPSRYKVTGDVIDAQTAKLIKYNVSLDLNELAEISFSDWNFLSGMLGII